MEQSRWMDQTEVTAIVTASNVPDEGRCDAHILVSGTRKSFTDAPQPQRHCRKSFTFVARPNSEQQSKVTGSEQQAFKSR